MSREHVRLHGPRTNLRARETLATSRVLAAMWQRCRTAFAIRVEAQYEVTNSMLARLFLPVVDLGISKVERGALFATRTARAFGSLQHGQATPWSAAPNSCSTCSTSRACADKDADLTGRMPSNPRLSPGGRPLLT
jgi:hypothetical protein